LFILHIGLSEHIKYKSARYHFESGKASRGKKLKKWTKVQLNIEKTRPAKQSWCEYVLFQLQHMMEIQDVYMQEKITRLRFDKFIKRDKTIANNYN
jgi:hypothetical protein